MSVNKPAWALAAALMLVFSLACACPLFSLFQPDTVPEVPAAAQVLPSDTAITPTQPQTDVPTTTPTANTSAVDPTPLPTVGFSFENRWRHYLDVYEALDPRYDFGSTFSVQWETVDAYGEFSATNGSDLLVAPIDEMQTALDFTPTDDTNLLWTITWPLNQLPGTLLLNPYNPTIANNAPSSLFYIGDELYAGQDGIIEIFESESGTITAKMLLFLVSTDDPARDAVVMAFFNQLPLNE